jgi:hypothetical protein
MTTMERMVDEWADRVIRNRLPNIHLSDCILTEDELEYKLVSVINEKTYTMNKLEYLQIRDQMPMDDMKLFYALEKQMQEHMFDFEFMIKGKVFNYTFILRERQGGSVLFDLHHIQINKEIQKELQQFFIVYGDQRLIEIKANLHRWFYEVSCYRTHPLNLRSDEMFKKCDRALNIYVSWKKRP